MSLTIPARPTIYAGIQMRSRLEARFAQMADHAKIRWAYEPQCFAGPDGQYLPDFSITDERGLLTYVEIKPPPILHDRPRLEAALRRMEIIWQSEPDADLELIVLGDVGTPDHLTAFSALGREDRRWRLSGPIDLPLIWDRP